ncbi:MAG: DUF1127 domain-containing protein [Roseibium sp.]|nr:DUF1127 domain-containing protein [Roseibium sp.]
MSSIETIHGRPVSRLHVRGSGNLIGLLKRKLGAWFHANRSRRQLLELTDAELRDLGLSRETAFREALRPFWDTNFDRKGGR